MSQHTARQFRLPFALVTVVLVATFGVAIVAVGEWQSERELEHLPADARRTLFGSLLATVRDSCSRIDDDDMTEYCMEQARFLARFPECETTCQQLCQRFVPRATK
jgi:hypothetical protein